MAIILTEFNIKNLERNTRKYGIWNKYSKHVLLSRYHTNNSIGKRIKRQILNCLNQIQILKNLPMNKINIFLLKEKQEQMITLKEKLNNYKKNNIYYVKRRQDVEV